MLAGPAEAAGSGHGGGVTVVAGTYALAQRINILGHHLSGPIAVVVAGLMIGNRGANFSMSEHTKTHLFGFWEMIDEILNSVFTKGAIPVLTWGGVRGGISVALALSLPENEYKPLILTATYCVVVFSIIVQGLTVKNVVQRVVDPNLL